MEDQAFEELDAYLFVYREEGEMVTGDWVRLVNNRRQYNQADKKELDRLAAVRRAEEEEREAREAIFCFQKESGEKAAAVQQKLTLASRRRAELVGAYQRVDPPAPQRWYTICSMPGVERGRDCPNSTNHHRYPRRK